jgi:hypothetical protein
VDPLDPVQIAEAIRWVADHPEMAREMGRRGRKAVDEQYNWEREAYKLRMLYERIGLPAEESRIGNRLEEHAVERVSVTIPVYNEEAFIKDVLSSLVDQDYSGHIEIILVDAASTNATAEIAAGIGRTMPDNRSLILLQNAERHIPISLNMQTFPQL